MAETKPFERLPTCVIPLHYDVYLKPNLNTFVFEGKVDIQLKVKKNLSSNLSVKFRMIYLVTETNLVFQVASATSKILCNAAELKIKDIKIITSKGEDLPGKEQYC
jgi:hypothetical protein